MNKSDKTIIFCLIFVLIMCLASYIAGRLHGREIGYNRGYSDGFYAPHPGDTISRTDTLYIDRPVPVSVKPSGVEFYPVGTIAQLQARIDSLAAVKPDTAFVEVPVPIETKLYQDSTYKAQVSGFRPSLDWIEVYQRTQTITQYIDHPAPRWSFGLTAGPGVLWDGGFHAGLGIVAGLQYRF